MCRAYRVVAAAAIVRTHGYKVVMVRTSFGVNREVSSVQMMYVRGGMPNFYLRHI